MEFRGRQGRKASGVRPTRAGHTMRGVNDLVGTAESLTERAEARRPGALVRCQGDDRVPTGAGERRGHRILRQVGVGANR